jgi:ribonuclease J
MNQFKYSNNLRIHPYGGIDNVTKNMFIYEFGHDILVVDCGIGFPDDPGKAEENLLIPDFSYLEANKNRVRGIVITHAHFDHYGAVPNLLQKLNVPVYASRLTGEFIKNKAKDIGLKSKHIDLRLINKKDTNIKIGSFTVTPFHVNHSVPEALGLFLKTPIGSIFHVSDFKFDFTPVDEEPFDIQKMSQLASTSKPQLLLSDCLGAAKTGHTQSESNIQEVLENLMIRSQGLVVVTTVSTNISRIKQTIKASANVGRKVSFLGRSVEESSRIAQELGYFSSLKNYILPTKKIKRYSFSKLTLIVAGSYGQPSSSLVKISKNKHHLVKLKKQDTVIFSADPAPPGVILDVNNLVDDLTKLGAMVYYYEIQDNLHVSGHGTAEDIKMLISIIKPETLLPIGGEFRHMNAYSLLAQQMGYKENQIILPEEKQVVEISQSGRIIVK